MLLSVITPCFNSERTIERTINSVVNQYFCNIEYIIVDGSSTDNTINIIENYARKYDFIKYISEKDNSMTEALNKGLRMATGDIICTINADDEFLNDTFEKVLDYFRCDNTLKLIVGNTNVINDYSKSLIYKATPKYMNNYLLMCVLDCPTPECGVFFTKECFDKLGLFDESFKYTQDYEFYLRLIKNNIKFKYINVDISNFYLSPEQYSTAAHDKMLLEVKSYIGFYSVHVMLKRYRLIGLIRTLIGSRRYNNWGNFLKHGLKKKVNFNFLQF